MFSESSCRNETLDQNRLRGKTFEDLKTSTYIKNIISGKFPLIKTIFCPPILVRIFNYIIGWGR